MLEARLPFRGPHYMGVVRRDGSFRFVHVAPGDYMLRAPGQVVRVPGDLYSYKKLRVGDVDQRGLTIRLREAKPVDIKGSITVREGGAAPVVLVELTGNQGRHYSARSNSDGSFLLPRILPDHYEISSQVTGKNARALYVESGVMGGIDVGQAGIDVDSEALDDLVITISTHRIEVTGKALDASGSPLVRTTIEFVEAESYEQIFTITDANGAWKAFFRRAGSYNIYDASAAGTQWDDWDYLKSHAKDLRPVTVNEAENPPITIQTKRKLR